MHSECGAVTRMTRARARVERLGTPRLENALGAFGPQRAHTMHPIQLLAQRITHSKQALCDLITLARTVAEWLQNLCRPRRQRNSVRLVLFVLLCIRLFCALIFLLQSVAGAIAAFNSYENSSVQLFRVGTCFSTCKLQRV
jgi:hypothetical protein